ncbi:MAG: isocitrate lyase/PEP mutase family protein [Candidatus Binataceae bacterium]
MTDARARLRELLARPGTVVAPFAYDCIQARLAEQAGFQAVYMTGFGTAAARGYPDLGILTMSEMAANVRAICGSVNVPVIADADTGYGNPVNVARTVREYEDAGAAALHIEDQVWPKRCGFLAGKQVIPIDDMIAKVRAACDARRDANFVIIGRSDALQPNGWDDTIRRVRAYRDAGADMLFVDGIMTVPDLERYARELNDLPLLYSGSLLPVDELSRHGFKVVIHLGTLLAAYEHARDALAELKRTGNVKTGPMVEVVEEFSRTMGVEKFLATADKYRA